MMQKIIPETPVVYKKQVNRSTFVSSTSGCLFAIDLDKFKEVNDTFGHVSVDLSLIKVANKLTLMLNQTQIILCVGGGNFIVWAPKLKIEDAQNLAQKLVEVCNKPIMIHKLSIIIGASIGFEHYPSHAKDAE